jgi:23S rRNA (pseudouridine1915-N3)-methyltransferase
MTSIWGHVTKSVYLHLEEFSCMKIKLLQIGKTTEAYLSEGIAHYEKRINGFIPQSTETIPALKDTNTATPENMKFREGELILARLKPDDVVVLLDENGKTFNSVSFSNFLEKQFNQSIRNLVFIIGGAYGFSDAVYKRANFKIALSEMTFSHQLVRLVFMEQLYRGMTIIHKHPYHHQ